MELIDMKLSAKKEETAPAPVEAAKNEGPQYPYGLQLRFDNDQVEKIPSLKEYEVGDRIAVQGEAIVTSVSINKQQGGETRHYIELQIEKVGCAKLVEKPAEQLSPKEYRKMREGSLWSLGRVNDNL